MNSIKEITNYLFDIDYWSDEYDETENERFEILEKLLSDYPCVNVNIKMLFYIFIVTFTRIKASYSIFIKCHTFPYSYTFLHKSSKKVVNYQLFNPQTLYLSHFTPLLFVYCRGRQIVS